MRNCRGGNDGDWYLHGGTDLKHKIPIGLCGLLSDLTIVVTRRKIYSPQPCLLYVSNRIYVDQTVVLKLSLMFTRSGPGSSLCKGFVKYFILLQTYSVREIVWKLDLCHQEHKGAIFFIFTYSFKIHASYNQLNRENDRFWFIQEWLLRCHLSHRQQWSHWIRCSQFHDIKTDFQTLLIRLSILISFSMANIVINISK
jgi:hypothetical protein